MTGAVDLPKQDFLRGQNRTLIFVTHRFENSADSEPISNGEPIMNISYLSECNFEPMTIEKLRHHLFYTKKVPFWNYDESKISIGVEVEYFIAQVTRSGFRLATQIEFLLMTELLKANYGYVDWNLPDQPGRISKDTEFGFIAIKPDFAWHILEISLPPRRSSSEIRSLLRNVFLEVDEALASLGMERLDLSCLPVPPKSMEHVSLNRLREISTTFRQKSAVKPTQDPNFPAYLAATHVHLNASSEEMLKVLPALYNLDRLVSKQFTRANVFNGRVYDNARTRMYHDTLGPDYLLHTYPENPAHDLQTMVSQMNRSPRLFPSDPFFPVRDMSYIRPTRYGTLEFRSCCSFKSIETLVKIVDCRIAQLLSATGVDRNRIYKILSDENQGRPS